MSKFSDQEYLLTDQYKDTSNLNARIQLHRRFSTNKYGWPRWVFDQIDLPAECRILDLGCGPGNLWHKNLDRVPAGWNITLTDFSPGMVEKAQENLQGSGRPFAFDIVDAQDIPCGDASFDAVIANHMLYHVPDMSKALSEMHRVLRPGGKFYTTTVGVMHMQELFQIIARFDPKDEFEHTIPSFILENGAEQLAPWFSEIKLCRYEDDLKVTEAKPLIVYVKSMMRAKAVFKDGKLPAFIEYVQQELATHGVIHITKDSGMFEAIPKQINHGGQN